MGMIYMATSPSGKQYIGQTSGTLKKRVNEHRSFSKVLNHKLYQAIRKYGFETFTWEVLHQDIAEPKMLDVAEICSIYVHDTFKHGYNMTEGGRGTHKVSQETRQKISKSKKGHPPTVYSKLFTVWEGDRHLGNWIQQSACAEVLGIDPAKISKVLSGKRPNSGRYRFEVFK